MNILQVHNCYSSGLAGEYTVLNAEKTLLESKGHRVDQYIVNNGDVETGTLAARVKAVFSAIWSINEYSKVLRKVKELKPDIVHVHNTFMVLSPSVFWAVYKARVPVVLTTHNYRTVCPASLLLRNNMPCTLCVGRYPWPSIMQKCTYKNSFLLMLSIAATISVHRLLRTYSKAVSAVIALSNFQRSILVRSNFGRDLVVTKPNFMIDNGCEREIPQNGKRRVVFAGLIAKEKGLDILLDAWSRLPSSNWELYIVGDGPERLFLDSKYSEMHNIVWCGRKDKTEVQKIIRSSEWLVIPSRWFEGCPMVIIEAFQGGTPVIAAGHGGMLEMVVDQSNGLLFTPDDSDSLKTCLASAFAKETLEWQQFSASARQSYEEHYSPEVNYRQLMDIYDGAIKTVAARTQAKK